MQTRVRSFLRGNRLLAGAARWIISHLAPREARAWESRRRERSAGYRREFRNASEMNCRDCGVILLFRNLDSATRDGCCAERVGGVGKCRDLSISHLPRVTRVGKEWGEVPEARKVNRTSATSFEMHREKNHRVVLTEGGTLYRRTLWNDCEKSCKRGRASE